MKKNSIYRIVLIFLILSFSFLHLVVGSETSYAKLQHGSVLSRSLNVPTEESDQASFLQTMGFYLFWMAQLFIIVCIMALFLSWRNNLLKQELLQRKNMEQRLQQYAAELKHSNEMKDLFADILRHDLLNPAGVISGYTEHLLEIETDVKKLQYLKSISRSNQKLTDLIEEAASFTKLDTLDSIPLEKKDIGCIITNVIESMRMQISEKNAKVSFFRSGPYPANVNTLMEQVFVNFLSNALKYGPRSGSIDINVMDAGNSWKVCFADEGDGIPEKFKEAIFERFRRVEKGAIKGSGLGLAIAKKIVELHGGQVGVTENPIGEGSVFWATFPKA